MVNKLTLTQQLITQYPDAPLLDEAMVTWWQNIRDDGGLRLTQQGFSVFENLLDLESYLFQLPDKLLTPKNLIALDHHMASPYYIETSRKCHSMIMFGSRHAMMAVLHGNMQQFIDSLRN